MLPAVARALETVVDDQPEDAIRSIARLDALVLLDNCEHVIDEATTLVDRVVNVADSHLHIVATSQVRLGVSIEAVVTVGPGRGGCQRAVRPAGTRRCPDLGWR